VYRAIAVIGIALILAGCLPVVEITPTLVPPTETITQTSLPTATIIWFPATPTFTTFPTREIQPTEDMRSGVGKIILEDQFDDPDAWVSAQVTAGNVGLGHNELTLAVSAAQASLISWRQSAQLSNFYLEIDALPSLCQAEDAYGLLLRANSGLDYYRLQLNCNGQIRRERIKNGKTVPLQDWVGSGQIFPGGMMRSRIGVWALEDEMRVFINGSYQFSVRDPVWESGQLGVFARSAGDTPLTVNYSNLVVYDLVKGQTLSTTRTPTVIIQPSRPVTATARP